MAAKRIVVIGGSSGGLEALRTIAAGLPPGFPAAVCVVLHMAADSPGVVDAILARSGPLPASAGTDGERLREGHIYVAPPDHHLLVEPGVLRVTRGPKENRFRPAVDPLFRSAAQVFGPAAIGVVLTGSLDDGTAGLWAVKQLGGIAIAQDPADAPFPSMPRSAIRHVNVDHIVPLAAIAPLLDRVVAAPVDQRGIGVTPHHLEVEVDIAKERNAAEAGLEEIGVPSPFACPECHGVLLRLQEGKQQRFRCHTGHAYSVQSLVAAVSEGIDDALWIAVRALEEGSLLLQHLSTHAGAQDDGGVARELAAQARDARSGSEAVRKVARMRRAFAADRT
jgi:two-component system chemotaxis response regulator CheB